MLKYVRMWEEERIDENEYKYSKYSIKDFVPIGAYNSLIYCYNYFPCSSYMNNTETIVAYLYSTMNKNAVLLLHFLN